MQNFMLKQSRKFFAEKGKKQTINVLKKHPIK